jgi:pyruvate dehydrogenase E1 component alpha subunit
MLTKSSKKTTTETAPSLISDTKLHQLYAMMLKCRILDSHARSLSNGSSWKGKEAVAVGAAVDLRPEDTIVFSSSVAVACFLKGEPLRSIFRHPDKRSLRGSKKQSKTVAKPGAAAQSALATGIAYASSIRNKESVTVALLSESPENCEAARDAFRLAGEQHLPIVYVYRETPTDMTQMHSYGFPVIPVDGNDVVAVYRVAYECIVRARRGGGPSVIVCRFFPKNGRVGANQDPLQNMERYLTAKGLFKKERKQSTALAFEKTIAVARRPSHQKEPRHEAQHVFVM